MELLEDTDLTIEKIVKNRKPHDLVHGLQYTPATQRYEVTVTRPAQITPIALRNTPFWVPMPALQFHIHVHHLSNRHVSKLMKIRTVESNRKVPLPNFSHELPCMRLGRGATIEQAVKDVIDAWLRSRFTNEGAYFVRCHPWVKKHRLPILKNVGFEAYRENVMYPRLQHVFTYWESLTFDDVNDFRVRRSHGTS